MTPDQLTRIQDIVSHATGERVRIIEVQALARARGPVARIVLDYALPGLGRTVIAKSRDVAAMQRFADVNLRTEVAVLEMLAASEAADIAPRLIGGDAAAGVVVLSDAGHPLEDVLFADDPDAATAALVALGASAGTLHRARVDSSRLDALGTWTVASRDPGWPALEQALRDHEFPTITGDVDEEHEALQAELRAPGSHAALVHGDLGPNNAVLDRDGHCTFVDFEGSGVQHVGLDAAMIRFPFAWYGRWAALPSESQRAMEDSYRAAVGRNGAAIDEAIAVGAVAMAALRLERLPRIADPEQPPEDARRRRTQIVATLRTAVQAARAAGRYPNLAAWLDDVRGAAVDRWEDARRPPVHYPAFAATVPAP